MEPIAKDNEDPFLSLLRNTLPPSSSRKGCRGAEYYPDGRDAVPPNSTSAQILRAAYAAYTTADILPYHNWETHIVPMERFAAGLCERLAAYGMKVDRRALFLAIRFHDALSHLDERALGMNCKEDLSAEYSCRVLQSMGAGTRLARKVARIVKATHPDATPRTIEEMVIRAADVSNLAAPYEIFKGNTLRLHEEAQRTAGKEIDFEAFIDRSYRLLSKYLAASIFLTPEAFDSGGRSKWHMKALGNLLRLHREARDNPVRVCAFLSLMGRENLPARAKADVVIAVADRRDTRDSLALLTELDAAQGEDRPVFALPGTESKAPIPTGICDLIHLKIDGSMETITEALRIAAPTSEMVLHVGESTPMELMHLTAQTLLTAGFQRVEASHDRLTFRR